MGCKVQSKVCAVRAHLSKAQAAALGISEAWRRGDEIVDNLATHLAERAFEDELTTRSSVISMLLLIRNPFFFGKVIGFARKEHDFQGGQPHPLKRERCSCEGLQGW